MNRKVIVNPNVPLRMEDFAQLYTGGGRSVEENASDLAFNAPSQGRDYIDSQWRNLGITGSPEQFFASPEHAAATMAVRAGVPTAATPPQWPTFRNETERQLAYDSGAVDPSYPNPLMKKAVEVHLLRQAADDEARSSYQSSINPLSVLTDSSDPRKILSAQLAGDVHGDTKRVLQSLQGINPEIELSKSPVFREQMVPYSPTAGLNGIPSEEAMNSKLDLHLINDPEFQRIQAQDPRRAHFVYAHATGRDYQSDLAIHAAIQKKRASNSMNFFQSQMARGATRDGATGEWKVWQDVPADPNAIGDNRPTRQMVKATPEQQQWMDESYRGGVGHALPSAVVNPDQAKMLANALEDLHPTDQAAYLQHVHEVEKLKGAPANAAERLALMQLTASKSKVGKGIVDLTWNGGVNLAGKGLDLARSIVPEIVGDKWDELKGMGRWASEELFGSLPIQTDAGNQDDLNALRAAVLAKKLNH